MIPPGSPPRVRYLEAVVTAEPPPAQRRRRAIIVRVSDYLDGALTGAEHAEVARQIAEDAAWKRAHTELTETRQVLSGLRKAHAPSGFADDVAETIHKRSAGQLFRRRTLGRPVQLFGVLLIVALAGLAVIGYILWSSSRPARSRSSTPARPPRTRARPRLPPP